LRFRPIVPVYKSTCPHHTHRARIKSTSLRRDVSPRTSDPKWMTSILYDQKELEFFFFKTSICMSSFLKSILHENQHFPRFSCFFGYFRDLLKMIIACTWQKTDRLDRDAADHGTNSRKTCSALRFSSKSVSRWLASSISTAAPTPFSTAQSARVPVYSQPVSIGG
jgi:hypothetical protein